jgi:hypothetical protein
MLKQLQLGSLEKHPVSSLKKHPVNNRKTLLNQHQMFSLLLSLTLVFCRLLLT